MGVGDPVALSLEEGACPALLSSFAHAASASNATTIETRRTAMAVTGGSMTEGAAEVHLSPERLPPSVHPPS